MVLLTLTAISLASEAQEFTKFFNVIGSYNHELKKWEVDYATYEASERIAIVFNYNNHNGDMKLYLPEEPYVLFMHSYIGETDGFKEYWCIDSEGDIVKYSWNNEELMLYVYQDKTWLVFSIVNPE